MLSGPLAHAGRSVAPHDLWSAWNLHPFVVGGVLLVVWAYRRGRTPGPQRVADRRRTWCFGLAIATVLVALVSPLDAASGALASAHMIQHVLLVVVAAPLLALSAPSSTLLRGTPPALRRASGRVRRRLGLGHGGLRFLRHPATAWLLHVGTLWWWHAAVAYDAAVRNDVLHGLEHLMFLATAVLLWHVVVGPRRSQPTSNGLGVLLIFGVAMQSVLLSLLLTFAREPWYSAYTGTTTRWGLDPLADQQLAGVIMWVPGGFVYLAATLALLVGWLRQSEQLEPAT